MSPTAPTETASPTTLAAVDLGSNSFHMLVVRAAHDGFQVEDRLREICLLYTSPSPRD